MNARRVIVVLSLLALVQIALLLAMPRRQPPVEPAPAAAPAPAAPAAAAPRSAPLPPAPTEVLASFRWASLESTNYMDYIRNLRAFGVPEPTVRDIIIAEVNHLYASLEAPLKAALTDRPGPSQDFAARRAAVQKQNAARQQLRDQQRQKNALLKTLLGVAVAEDLPGLPPQEAERFQSAFSALPEAKRDAVREIQEDYWRAVDELRASAPPWGAEYHRALARLKAERAAQLAKVLTPEEREEFDMRTSPIGAELTELLNDFPATEAEYRLIFRIRQQLAEGDSADASLSPLEREARAEEQLKAALGPERYAEYERAQDPAYQELTQLARRFDLPKDQLDRSYAAVRDFRRRAEQIEADDNLSAAQQETALKTLRAQLEKALVETFGEKAARAFKRQSDIFLDDEMP